MWVRVKIYSVQISNVSARKLIFCDHCRKIPNSGMHCSLHFFSRFQGGNFLNLNIVDHRHTPLIWTGYGHIVRVLIYLSMLWHFVVFIWSDSETSFGFHTFKLLFQWHLLCKGNEWYGEKGNCTEMPVDDTESSTQRLTVFGDISFPMG